MIFKSLQLLDAEIFTWEYVSGFDVDLPVESARKFFNEDVSSCKNPCREQLLPLISFNDSEGRRHRFLVLRCRSTLNAGSLSRCLPQMICLFGYADNEMRRMDSDGNVRWAFVDERKLYILVFFEGRLCHWQEEKIKEQENVQIRLNRFDEFLKTDSLFGRVAEFSKKDIVWDKLQNADSIWIKTAARDPLWKNVNLAYVEPRKRIRGLRLVFLLVALTVFSGSINFIGDKKSEDVYLQDVPAPELDTRLPSFVDEKEFKAIRNNLQKASQTGCHLASFKLKAIVSNKIVKAVVGEGSERWLSIGDSIATTDNQFYRIAFIGRNSIRLVCNGNSVEVTNGA